MLEEPSGQTQEKIPHSQIKILFPELSEALEDQRLTDFQKTKQFTPSSLQIVLAGVTAFTFTFSLFLAMRERKIMQRETKSANPGD